MDPSISEVKHDAARTFAAAGYPIVPIVPNAKIPLTAHGWKDGTTDPATVDGWYKAEPRANIGWCPETVGMCLIDLEGKQGIAEWNRLCAEHGTDPETGLMIGTPSGGRHIVYAGSLPGTVKTLGDHIDTRGVGTYGLLPPSYAVEEKKGYEGPYTFLAGDPSVQAWDLPDVPAWVFEACKPKVTEPRKAANHTGDQAQALRMAEHYIATHERPIEGAGSDHATYQAMARFRDLGLDDTVSLELLQGWTGFDEDWVQEKLDHVDAYKQNEDGCDAPLSLEETFPEFIAMLKADNVVDLAQARAERDSLFSTGKDRRLLTVGPIEELIPGLIEKYRVAYMSATGGLNKSRIAQHWGACLHTGTDLYGRKVERAHFVHISYENGTEEDARRHQTLLRRLEIDPTALDDHTACDWQGKGPVLLIDEACNIEPTPLWTALEDKLRSIEGHKFIVFDSLYDAFAFQGQAKLSETAVKRTINWLDWKMRELDATGLVLQHPSRAGMDRGDNSGWSVAWTNAPRLIIALKPIKGMPSTVELEVTKRNNAALGLHMTLHWMDGLMLPMNDAEQNNNALYEACISVAIRACNGGIPLSGDRAADIGDYCTFVNEECGVRPSPSELRKQLARARIQGRLVHRGRTRHQRAGYYPPDPDHDDVPL